VPVPCFLLFLCFRKVTQEIFLELGEIKAKHPVFNEASKRPKRRRRGARSRPHSRAAWPSPWPHPLCVRPPRSTSNVVPLPIKTPQREKPKDPINFQKHIMIHRRHRPEIGRVQKLFPAPCRRGESPPEIFFIAMLASSAMCE
jgi:hypothetical protein